MTVHVPANKNLMMRDVYAKSSTMGRSVCIIASCPGWSLSCNCLIAFLVVNLRFHVKWSVVVIITRNILHGCLLWSFFLYHILLFLDVSDSEIRDVQIFYNRDGFCMLFLSNIDISEIV